MPNSKWMTTERPQRIELALTSLKKCADKKAEQGVYDPHIKDLYGTLDSRTDEYIILCAQFVYDHFDTITAALNGMQPDVTGDDEKVVSQIYQIIMDYHSKGNTRIWKECVAEMNGILARHRQSAVEAATGELVGALGRIIKQADDFEDPRGDRILAGQQSAYNDASAIAYDALMAVGIDYYAPAKERHPALTKAAQGGK